MLNATPLLNAIYSALTAAGVSRIYQHGQTLPEVLPPDFVVLQPLFATVRQEWAQRRLATHQVQVLCCATGPGTARNLIATVEAALPPDKYVITGTSYENHSGTHYEIPLTIQALT